MENNKIMKTKHLYIILIIGLLLSIGSLNTGHGGSGLYIFFKFISITLLIVFVGALIIILKSFKKSKSNIHVWFLLLIGAPISIMILKGVIQNLYIEIVDTTTPKKYLNKVIVPLNTYTKDTVVLKKVIFDYYNLENKIWKKHPNLQRKILALRIDTMIYGKDNKFVGLAIFDDYNEYLKKLDSSSKPVSYQGECVIGFKKNDTIKITNILGPIITSVESRKDLKKYLRQQFFKTLSLKKNNYNINDVRFWDIDSWKYDKVKKQKDFYLKQQDSTIETSP